MNLVSAYQKNMKLLQWTTWDLGILMEHEKFFYQPPSPKGEGAEVSKMAIREGTVFWGVWGGFPPILGRTGPRA